MKAYGLFREGATVPDLWMCGECHNAAANHALAEKCCACHWTGCDRQPAEFRMFCAEHDKANDAENERKHRAAELARFEKARKITAAEYKGEMVYCEALDRSEGEGYFPDVDEFVWHCEDKGIDVPTFVWACTRKTASTDAGRVIEAALENTVDDAHEHFGERREEVARLQAMLDAWWADNEFAWFEADYKVAILVPKADVTGETEAGDAAR